MKLRLNLKTLMDKERISLVELAKLSKVPKQTIHNWLSGAEPKSVEQLRSVASIFRLTIEELCFSEKPSKETSIEKFSDEINAGIFEVVLRRVKK